MSQTTITRCAGQLATFGALWMLPALTGGCGAASFMNGPGNSGQSTTGLTAEVAAKAYEVAQQVGGASGFGGRMMNGYMSQMPAHMGFRDISNLADGHERTMVELRNDSGEPATFGLVYLSNSMGMNEQTMPVTVPAGAKQTVELPCAEIIGLGSLTSVGDTAVELADNTQFDNRMCVPGFLGSDYQCGDTYGCYLAPDVADWDRDGDTQELTVSTEAAQSRMGTGGMSGRGPMMTGSMRP